MNSSPGRLLFFPALIIIRIPGLAGHTNITGVVEKYDIRSTLNTALALQPDTRSVFIINDQTTTGRENKKTIDAIIPEYPDTVTFTYLTNYSMPELQAKVRTLPADSIILLMSFNRDRLGNDFSYSDSLRLIHENATVPIYGMWEMYLGKGIVGGSSPAGMNREIFLPGWQSGS